MPMRVPNFKEDGLKEFLERMIEERERNDNLNLSRITANHSLLLQSPGGKVFEITVDDAGVIVRTLRAG